MGLLQTDNELKVGDYAIANVEVRGALFGFYCKITELCDSGIHAELLTPMYYNHGLCKMIDGPAVNFYKVNEVPIVKSKEERKINYEDTVETSHTLITNTELMCDIIHEYIKPELDKCIDNGGYWRHAFYNDFFCWYLTCDSSGIVKKLGSLVIKENDEIIGFDIYNTNYSNKNHANIKIRKDRIEFIEDSEFKDFNRDFMCGLYEKIKEYVIKKEKEEGNET